MRALRPPTRILKRFSRRMASCCNANKRSSSSRITIALQIYGFANPRHRQAGLALSRCRSTLRVWRTLASGCQRTRTRIPYPADPRFVRLCLEAGSTPTMTAGRGLRTPRMECFRGGQERVPQGRTSARPCEWKRIISRCEPRPALVFPCIRLIVIISRKNDQEH